jgi:hypothetical protein
MSVPKVDQWNLAIPSIELLWYHVVASQGLMNYCSTKEMQRILSPNLYKVGNQFFTKISIKKMREIIAKKYAKKALRHF